MRVLGLNLWPNRRTDEEYIAQLRKGIHTQRWLRLLHASIGLAMLVICIRAIALFVRVLTTPSMPPQQQSLVYLTFVAAVILGLTLGFWLAQAAMSVAAAFFDHRKDRMLVECWDAMNVLLEERENTTNHNRPRPHEQLTIAPPTPARHNQPAN